MSDSCKNNSNKEACTIQKYYRGYLSRKTNIFYRFKNKKIYEKFKKELIGYHIVNDDDLKESRWEEINCNIVCDFHKIDEEEKAKGNHFSGKDNKIDNWNISNKSVKVNIEKGKKKISLSSYRLTSVCSENNPNNIDDILKEISNRDNSYEYYSIISREKNGQNIRYIWYIIPKKFKLINPNKQIWKMSYGKQGKRKGLINGWESENMKIIFSMSSQLWIDLNLEDIEKYKIHEINVDTTKIPKITYSDLYDKYMN